MLNKPARRSGQSFCPVYVQQGISDRYIQNGKLVTTLDSALQATVQSILDHRLKDLQQRHVTNGAVLVVDHETGEVLAWSTLARFHGFTRQSD